MKYTPIDPCTNTLPRTTGLDKWFVGQLFTSNHPRPEALDYSKRETATFSGLFSPLPTYSYSITLTGIPPIQKKRTNSVRKRTCTFPLFPHPYLSILSQRDLSTAQRKNHICRSPYSDTQNQLPPHIYPPCHTQDFLPPSPLPLFFSSIQVRSEPIPKEASWRMTLLLPLSLA